MMNFEQSLAFIKQHGAVFESAIGRLPRLVEAIVGEPIKGSWWSHAGSHEIYAILTKLTQSPDLCKCRIVDGKLTIVHRRLWPALVRLQSRFTSEQLTQITQEHTGSGEHRNRLTKYPDWVPRDIMKVATTLRMRSRYWIPFWRNKNAEENHCIIRITAAAGWRSSENRRQELHAV